MHKTEARAGQLVRWNAKQDGRYVQTSPIEIAKELESRIGKIYGLIIADAPTKVGEALFAHIEDAVGRGTLEAVRRAAPDTTHEQMFESAVAQVNHAVSRVLGERGLGIEPEFVSAAIVAVHDHDINAAIWGRPTILLFHPTTTGMNVYDLVDDDGPQSASAQRRCFGSVISGRIGDFDRLLLATQDIRELVGDVRMAEAMDAEDPGMSTKMLRDALAPLEEELTIAVLAIDVAPVRYIEEIPAGRAVTTQTSLDGLRRMESRTEEILSPNPLASIQKTIGSAASAMRGSHAKKQAPAHPAAAVTHTPTPHVAPRPKVSISAILVKSIAWLFHSVFALVKGAFTTDWRTLPRHTVIALDGSMDRLVANFNGLTPLRKRLLLAIMLGIFALNGIVFGGGIKAGLDDFATAANRRVAAIGQKVDSAEASIIYRDESRAKALLAEAETETVALSERTAKDREAKTELGARIAAARDGMRRAIQLGTPDVVATVATNGETPNLTRLTTAAGALWSVSAKGELFRISLADGAAQKSGDIAAEPKIVLPVQGGVLAAAASGIGAIAPTSGKAAAKDVRIDTQGAAITDADTWNGNLYVLDPAHNRILRHAADADGFGAPAFYLKDGTDVTKGVSIAIDGAVWVLDANGGVTSLLKGVRATYAASVVEPPMTAALRIRTTPKSEFFYILDSSPSRIVRVNKKTGTLVAQYESPSLDGATDFTVDESTKTLLVSVGNQVLRFGLPN